MSSLLRPLAFGLARRCVARLFVDLKMELGAVTESWSPRAAQPAPEANCLGGPSYISCCRRLDEVWHIASICHVISEHLLGTLWFLHACMHKSLRMGMSCASWLCD